MNILFIVPYPPSQIRVRPYNIIRYLARQGHKIVLYSLYTNQKELEECESMREYCQQVKAFPLSRWRSFWNATRMLPSKIPLQSMYCWHPGMMASLTKDIQSGRLKPDVIHIEHLRGARYGLALANMQNGGGSRIPVIWDSVDCISLLFEQAINHHQSFTRKQILRLELPRTKEFERKVLSQFARILVTSPIDLQAMMELRPKLSDHAKITVLPNGVELNDFHPDSQIREDPYTLIISGKMSYHANIVMVNYFVKEILPLIKDQIPEVRLNIVGKDPPRSIRAMNGQNGITVTGTVKEMQPFLQRASAAVAPLQYSVGIQNKILEAMACGTPVVTTSKAVSALFAVPGRDILIADDPEGFAEITIQLLKDKNTRTQLGIAGRNYIETHHNWSKITQDLSEIYLTTQE